MFEPVIPNEPLQRCSGQVVIVEYNENATAIVSRQTRRCGLTELHDGPCIVEDHTGQPHSVSIERNRR